MLAFVRSYPLPFLTADLIASISADNKYSLVLISEYLRELGDLDEIFSALPTFDSWMVASESDIETFYRIFGLSSPPKIIALLLCEIPKPLQSLSLNFLLFNQKVKKTETRSPLHILNSRLRALAI